MTENKNIVEHHHQTPDEIKKICTAKGDGNVQICRINEELDQGMKEMENYTNSVTFYGSARFKEGDEYYNRARTLGNRISTEVGATIITGGGPGIMEAGNRGAFEAGGKSLGLTIKLPMEQTDNKFVTDEIPFNFFFARKMSLSFSSEVFVYFPGGFGTLDECFEVLTLIQTKKLPQIPVILYGTDFWKPVVEIFKTVLLEKFHTISPEDMSLFTVTDDDDLVIDIIKKAKPRVKGLAD
ncbi:MAG: TIGR00730 family Rossman fold protein [Candidatus Pacebacteria bacterium]|nr:TIGR00730 family Rossman fold protein [Candidatus Paceibacterota bacterium]